ncbi:MAG: hypothetical protein P8144_13230 [Gammaproteobacteria bacterium]
MFDHLSTYATHFEASKTFYDHAMSALGYSIQMEFVAEHTMNITTVLLF